jgi:aminoglycoside phosphotransferase (APT) family kinase protein
MRVHDDELEIDEPLVRSLLEEQFPEWADLPLERAGDGTVNVIYRLGDELSVRLPRRGGEWADQEREAAILTAVGGRLPVAVPEVRGIGRPGRGYPWPFSIHTWLRGELPEQPVTADELAALLTALHRLEPAGAPERAGGRGRPLRERDVHVRDALTRFEPRPGTIELWEAGRDAPEWEGPPLWGHCDLDARNVLVLDGRLAAVLDWSGAGPGDPAVDVMAAWKLLPAGERGRFRELLAVDDATWLRAQGWLVSQALLALAYYTVETEPTLVREASNWLREVLDEC